jgi:dTDP-4-dehydrorhamnose reductase
MSVRAESILVTGGSGLLGTALRKVLPQAAYPSSSQFDIRDFVQMNDFLSTGDYSVLVHAAAFTSPPRIDRDPVQALETNILGTANVVRLCMRHELRLIYVSTDYVFRGDAGLYGEGDAVYPVNKYAWSKLGGECAARLYDKALIIRTSFGPDSFPFPKAFEDQWTSRESVSVFAHKLLGLLESDVTGTLHVGGPRRTVLEYARSLDSSKRIEPLSTRDVPFAVPSDSSLDCRRYESLIGRRRTDPTKGRGHAGE